MQRHRGILLLGVAILMALLTSALIYNWLEQQRSTLTSTEPTVVSMPTAMVAVATVDLTWGTKLTAEMIKLVHFPAQSLPEDYFSTVESTEGRVLIAHVKANEPFLESKLAPRDVTRGGVAAVTNPTKRAMAIKVDSVIGVAGFIHPGNMVDVLVTLRQTPPKAKTVLQNVLVLATGTQIESQGKESKPHQVRVITVEVTPEEAEKLALAANEGQLTLALRNYVNSEPVLTRGATISSLMNSYRLNGQQGPKRKVSSRVRETPPTQVEVIKGGSVSTRVFKSS